jgi:hypothetical protein
MVTVCGGSCGASDRGFGSLRVVAGEVERGGKQKLAAAGRSTCCMQASTTAALRCRRWPGSHASARVPRGEILRVGSICLVVTDRWRELTACSAGAW